MKILLFVEGPTERLGLPQFLKKWLDDQPEFAQTKTRLSVIKYDGVGQYLRKIVSRVNADLVRDPLACAVGLLDLYGLSIPEFALSGSRDDRYVTAKREIERRVAHPRFIQHFAVYETEAWLLANPKLFPRHAADQIANWGSPESVNFNRPPAKRLQEIQASPRGRTKGWSKALDGPTLLQQLDPADVLAAGCPHFNEFLTDMRDLAVRCTP